MKLIHNIIIFLVLISFSPICAQCVDISCNSNTGLFSNDTASDIAYDNMGSAFHSTYIKEPNGSWKVWGEYLQNDGENNVLSPLSFDIINYPALTGTIYKMAIGSSFGLNVQLVVLTSDGLFVLGTEGAVLDDLLTTSTVFQKITVNGKVDGLPTGVSPSNIKMMFASSGLLMITTCIGEVYVLSQSSYVRGDGGTGDSLHWSKVLENATTPLTNIIVARGSSSVGFALKSDGTLWTWGENTYLGNGSSYTNRNYATQMALPAGISAVKMIQATKNDYLSSGIAKTSYYVLGVDKKVYSLGFNSFGQLGDRTSISRSAWVNAKNPDDSVITDAVWISANEHDENFSAFALIKTNGVLYTSGNNSYYMIGRATGGANISGGTNYLDIPAGITPSDVITFAEAGGHTCALIKQCSTKYGYVGHRVRGSIGDGSTIDETIPSYDFTSPPAIAVCGAQYVQPVITSNGTICSGQDAIFTINGAVGDTLTYTINGGAPQTITIGTSGTTQVIVNNVTTNQIINFTHILSTVNCSYDLSITSNVTLVSPEFTQIAAICQGDIVNPLPVTSNNGISGSWSPAFDNMHTTQYTFTPTVGSCASTIQMTVVVNPKTTPIFPVFNALCFGDSQFTLPTLSNNGYSGTWSPSIDIFQTATYLFTPNNGQCATNTTTQVQIYDDFNFDITSFCQNNEFYLKIIPDEFNIETANFDWKYNNVTVSTDAEFNLSNYLISNSIGQPLPVIFFVTVRNSNACEKTKSVTVENIFCDIPNAITPNNDGFNDSFDLTLFNVKKISIYNRWGVKVYDKEGYLDEWYGQTNSGKILPDGTYFYILEFSSEEPKTGWVFVKN